MTFAASMTTLSGLARLLAGDSVDTAVDRTRTAAEGAARSAERLLDDPEAFATDLEAWHGGRDVIVLLGRGPARRRPSRSARPEGIRRDGRVAGIRSFPSRPVRARRPEHERDRHGDRAETRRLDLGLAADLVAGSAVMVVTPDGEAPKERPVATGYLDRALMSAVGVIPTQLLAWRLAGARDARPARTPERRRSRPANS